VARLEIIETARAALTLVGASMHALHRHRAC
jgi:hypothetical protein